MSVRCKHENVNWFNAVNEDGWECEDCGRKKIRSKLLDKKNLYQKIYAILFDLNNGGFVYISNGSQGEFICNNVCKRCEQERRFDQLFILKCIIEEPNIDIMGHSNFYWRGKQEGFGKKKEKKLNKDFFEKLVK